MKLVEKQRTAAKIKKIYDLARSPFKCVLENELKGIEIKNTLIETYISSDRFDLLEKKKYYSARILKIIR
jgi:hypothetical protein